MAKRSPPAPPGDDSRNRTTIETYVTIIQSQVNSDIQAVKSGVLDEELLRARLLKDMDPSSSTTRVALWLCALAVGMIDDLDVRVIAGALGPDFEFYPQWNQDRPAKAPVLVLAVPGPAKRLAAETQDHPDSDDEHDQELSA